MIVAALKNNHQLRNLNLGNNHIADEGAKYIGDLLKENCPLASINLGK